MKRVQSVKVVARKHHNYATELAEKADKKKYGRHKKYPDKKVDKPLRALLDQFN